MHKLRIALGIFSISVHSISALAQSLELIKYQNYTSDCLSSDSLCVSSKKEFISWFKKAIHGDYQGQRNVAYCLYQGCDGSVLKTKEISCAWRAVILASETRKIDSTDFNAFRLSCGSLNGTESVQASFAAKYIFKRIYKRSMEDKYDFMIFQAKPF